MLKVTVAEVQRDVIKQLGIDLSGSFNYGTAVVNFNTVNPFSATGQALSNTSIAGSFKNVTATLRAMERAGVIRTLAEPNLTAISGETATFLAGGEFPFRRADVRHHQVAAGLPAQIEFKKFGVSLIFTPVVLSEGRISLKVMTEVSELSTETRSPCRSPGATIAHIPSIKTRRAETVVEIPSGGSLAMAGMIQEQTKQSDQRPARADARSNPRHAVQEPRLRQPPDRADGSGHALRRARGGAEALVAAG